MALDRTWYNTLTDDSGSGTDGTVWDKAAVDALMDAIDAALNTSSTFSDDVIFTANKLVRRNTSDGSDNGTVEVNGGGATGSTRGGSLLVAGNEHATQPGYVDLRIGNIASALARILRSDGTASLSVNGATGVVTAAHGLTSTSTLTASALIDASGASAGQLKFPASQNASADANTLDDYEEGAWTPVIGGAGGTSGQSYSLQEGKYLKIGRLVFLRFEVVLSNKGTITDAVQIQGLPFVHPNESSARAGLDIGSFGNLATNWIALAGTGTPNASTIDLTGRQSAGVSAQSLATADIANNTTFDGSYVYSSAS